MLEVSEVLRNLGNAIRDMPRAQRLSIMNELFSKRAVAGGIKLTAASFDRLNEAIDQAHGTARRTAETMDSGIGLQELLLEVGWPNGFTGRNFRDSCNGISMSRSNRSRNDNIAGG